MKRLSTADALRFAIHCLTCHECAAAVEEAESFVRAVKVAAQQVRAEAPRKAPAVQSGHSHEGDHGASGGSPGEDAI